uniref:C2H2-type domain-containing protein n=1 Tax=Monopterus albus TaxID=43700 RepID=A0A3Q3K928_MONAL
GGEKLQDGDRGGDLSSINAMMSAVMSHFRLLLLHPISACICPLCDKSCQTQHQLTMHIRQHNTDAGATDHSCSICGKCLSSASSLDRHMLVHSGERPYKCNICGQTFTTNGNMHRYTHTHTHTHTHGSHPIEAHFLSHCELIGDELLPCPICFKTCNSRLELDAHMDTHPDTALRCDLCCLSFRTHRGLLRHNASVHKLFPQDPSGRPFIQNNPSIPTGFNDLAFIDFSCKKFAHIAQVWCETNLRRCISKFHRFICDCCDKAFPLRSALDLHKTTSHPDKPGDAGFLEVLGLQHVSKVTAVPTDDEIHQAHLDSIKVIHVEPPCSSLPQEPAASGSASALQSISHREALSLLSLQPFQTGFLLQPDGGAAAASAMGLNLPPLAKAPGFTGGQGRCWLPHLPPPTPTLFKTPSSSSSSSAVGSGEQMDAECMGDVQIPLSDFPPAAATAVQEEAGLNGRKPGTKGGNSGCSAKGVFPCRFCDQVFAFSGVLQANCERHLRKKHNKTSRKDIEKNIKYVTSTTTANIATTGCTGTETTCRFCGEDLKTYRALQIHLRTHNGCQRKPFECRRCGATFLAKRNCIHHLLKQHPEVQEREIEEHIAMLQPSALPAAAVTAAVNPMVLNGISQSPIQLVKVEELASVVYPLELDQPLDFSTKGRATHSQAASPGVKLESVSPSFDCSVPDQPIDLSIPSKRQRRESVNRERKEIKTEQSGSSIVEQQHPLSKDEKTALPPLHPHPQLGCYQLPPGSTPPPASLPSLNSSVRPQRLKPLLPKPTSSPPSSSLKELPPLASIAQIIHSVSGAPELLKREPDSLETNPQDLVATSQVDSASDAKGPSAVPETQSDDMSEGSKRARKKSAALLVKEKTNIDLESSGEFASVEKMLATTDANKFSNYLQTGSTDLGVKRGRMMAEKEGATREEGKPAAAVPQSRGKKNAYSNSVQKMTCPYCPRVFPWASSLQRHLLTHTGQKPFPCPRCDAFFSTKSNCERHLLRKHGVTHRTLRRNGTFVKKDGEEGSHESAGEKIPREHEVSNSVGVRGLVLIVLCRTESQSETEQVAPDVQDGPVSTDTGSSPNTESHVESADDDDCHSNKSLDLNFGKKLIDFKLSTSSSSQQTEYKHVCRVCKKSFRYVTTLARHERVHLCEETPAPALMKENPPVKDERAESSSTKRPEEETEEEHKTETEMEVEEGGMKRCESEAGESGESEEEDKEKEERSDEEAPEPKSLEGGEVPAGRVDKRKKICSVCGKRFWSLQDLTRHMRSHTGERPYQCQTCERTFTLKHSLVRHQRIHLKPRGADGSSAANDDGSEDGDSCTPTPTSTCPPSENESECGSGATGAKELEEEDVKEEVEGQRKADDEAESATLEEGSPAKPVTSGAEADPVFSESPDVEERPAFSADTTPSQHATDAKTTTNDEPSASDLKSTPDSNTSKDPSSSPLGDSTAAASAEGFVPGLLEIDAKPPLEHNLPNGEPPLLRVD